MSIRRLNDESTAASWRHQIPNPASGDGLIPSPELRSGVV